MRGNVVERKLMRTLSTVYIGVPPGGHMKPRRL